jgi:hypothetical protein
VELPALRPLPLFDWLIAEPGVALAIAAGSYID